MMFAVLVPLAVLCCAQPSAADDPGYVRQWLAVGNWRNLADDRRLVADDELPFEGHVTLGRLWTVVEARDDGFVDLNVLGPTGNETALAHVYVRSASDAKYRLLVGADDRAEIHLNGRRVHATAKSGGWRADAETVEVRLAKGWNRLLLRIDSERAAFGFSARFTLPDGRPVVLETSTAVPEEWLERPQLRRPLTPEGINDLLEALNSRINSVAAVAARQVREWESEGECLDDSYGRARDHAAAYVAVLQRVLETMPAAEDEQADAERRRQATEAAQELADAALAGPWQLAERTRGFVERAQRGARLWQMVRFAATTAYEAGRQAAEVDRATVEARGLVAAVVAEYLRPFMLREKTLRRRTAAVSLRLMARDGIPISGAAVSLEQLGHEFVFGCNLFAYGAFDSSEDQQRYEQSFLRLFNLAVVPVYWPLVEPVEGRVDYTRDVHGLPGPEPMVQWCRAQGLRVMAGPILTGEVRPLWLRDKSPEETARLVEAHVRDAVGRFRGQVDCWSLAPNTWPTLAFSRLRLPVSYLVGWAAKADVGARIFVEHSAAHALVNALQQEERRPFGLGGVVLGAYQADGAWPAEEFEATLYRLRTAEVPVYVSRVMIPGAAKDEAVQGRQVADFYRTAMAHPAVRGIIWWDLSDRFAYRGTPGGLLRKDLSPKPAYQALARLIRGEWWTTTDGRTDDMGRFEFRGFFGRYRLRATLPDGSVTAWEIDVESDGPRDIELLYPPLEFRGAVDE